MYLVLDEQLIKPSLYRIQAINLSFIFNEPIKQGNNFGKNGKNNDKSPATQDGFEGVSKG